MRSFLNAIRIEPGKNKVIFLVTALVFTLPFLCVLGVDAVIASYQPSKSIFYKAPTPEVVVLDSKAIYANRCRVPNRIHFNDRQLDKFPFFINIQKHFLDGPLKNEILASRIYVKKGMIYQDVERVYVSNKIVIDGTTYNLIHTNKSYEHSDNATCHFEFSLAKEY